MEETKKSFYSNLTQLKCSIITGIAKVIIVQPFDFIRYRIQSSLEYPVRINKLIKTIADKEGLKQFLKGSNATATGVFLSSFIQFTFYQKAYKHFMHKHFSGHTDIREYIAHAKGLTSLEKDKLIRQFSLYCGLSGLISGVFLATFTTPIDNIRIKLQARQNIISVSNKTYYINNTTLECIYNIFKDHGARGFYIAFPMAFLRETIASTIYFTTFEYMKNREKIIHNKDSITVAKSFVYGGLAGAINWLFTFPIDIVKTKVISDTITGERRYNGILDCMGKIYNTNGLYGFYTGFSVVLMRSLVVNGVVLTSFELCRSRL
jgi:solute carrier family 25 carnitine/acylcarnitine transporter 20/29